MLNYIMSTKWNEFTHSLKEKWAYVVVYVQLKYDGWRLKFAIHMANQLQKAKNKRFYVLENAQGKLIWLCNDDIKAMKKPRKVRKYVGGKFRWFKFYMLPPKTTHLDVMRDCLYYTQARDNNQDGLSIAERQQRSSKWLAYLEKKRMDRMFGKLKLK